MVETPQPSEAPITSAATVTHAASEGTSGVASGTKAPIKLSQFPERTRFSFQQLSEKHGDLGIGPEPDKKDSTDGYGKYTIEFFPGKDSNHPEKGSYFKYKCGGSGLVGNQPVIYQTQTSVNESGPSHIRVVDGRTFHVYGLYELKQDEDGLQGYGYCDLVDQTQTSAAPSSRG